ncbi:MAG: stage II sporulation protein M [Clostridia bacterium]|nr:stage II sporulation protein M [Clostridia bacterium]
MAKARIRSGLAYEHVRSNMPAYAIVFAVLLTGICFGAVYASVMKEGQVSASYLESGLAGLRTSLPTGQGRALLSSLGFNLATAGLMWLSGATVVGLPLVFFALFMRGFSCGFTVALMVREMSGPGAAVAVASVLPHNMVALPAMIVLGMASISFAWSVVRKKLLGLDADVQLAFARSVAAAIIAAIAMVVASFVQAYISPALLVLASRFV